MSVANLDDYPSLILTLLMTDAQLAVVFTRLG